MELINFTETSKKFRPVLKYCPKPCGGKQPCIRTCLCGPGMMLNSEGSCKPMTSKVKTQLLMAGDKSEYLGNNYLQNSFVII